MNLYPATAFIRHLLTSRSAAGHGVHSPFVFDFLTKVVRGKNDANLISRVERLRQEMLTDRRTVKVTDFGAGSVRRPGEERSISGIASSSALPARQAALLSRIAGSMRAGNSGIILELGTSLGISTLALALAAPQKRVVTVEGCPALAEIARENLLRHGAANAEVINMEFSEALDMVRGAGTTVSMAFIDGNHRGVALIQYAETIRSMGEEMIIVADDIHMNRDMYNAWCSLAATGKTLWAGNKISSRLGVTQPPPDVITPAQQVPPPYHALDPLPPDHPAPPALTLPLPSPLLTSPAIAPASLETFRFGILFCLHNLTPGHYRTRY